MRVHERTLFDRTSHKSLILFHWPAVTPHNDKAARQLSFVPGPEPFGDHAPRRNRMTTARRFPGAAAHRMIHRILGHGATQRTNPAVPASARLAQYHVLVLGVAYLPNGGETVFVELSDFARRQTNLCIAFVS